ncbi:cell growth regulator with EF hand domain protein 1 [Arapaima gigas]
MALPDRGRGHRAGGLPGESRGVSDALCPTALVLLLLLCERSVSAPQNPGFDRQGAADGSAHLALVNPFAGGEEERRLLQSYVEGNLKDGQLNPDLTTWEQEIFFLFSLHDYDRSGHLDGLEMMKLLTDFPSHHSLGPQLGESVVFMVDDLLQTRDQNRDGMLELSELLAPPMQPSDAEQNLAQEVVNDSAQPAETSVFQQQQEDHSEDQARGQEVQEEQGLGEQTQQDPPQGGQEVKQQQHQGQQVEEQNQGEQEKEEVQVLQQDGREVQGLDTEEQWPEQQEQEVQEIERGEEVAQEGHVEEQPHVSVHQGQPEI